MPVLPAATVKSRASLRILMMTEVYPPDFGGGAAVYVHDLAQALAARGNSVLVICATSQGAVGYQEHRSNDKSVEIVRISLPHIMGGDPEGWRLGFSKWKEHQRKLSALLTGIIRAWRADVVHCHFPRPFGEDALVAVQDLGIPYVWTLHDGWLLCVRLHLWRSPHAAPCEGPGPLRCHECIYSHYDGRWSALPKMAWRVPRLGPLPAYRVERRRALRRRPHPAIAVSRYLADLHRPYLSGTVEHLPLGIDLGDAELARVDRPRTPLQFGFLGGFAPHKGVTGVLRAAVSLKARALSFKLNIWGGGTPTSNDRALLGELGDRAAYHGEYTISNVWNVYQQIDVAVMASQRFEALGRVVGEAAAAGATVIAPRLGGISEQIQPGRDGLLFPVGDVEALTECMAQVVMDKALARRLLDGVRVPLDTRQAAGAVEDFLRDHLDNARARSGQGDSGTRQPHT